MLLVLVHESLNKLGAVFESDGTQNSQRVLQLVLITVTQRCSDINKKWMTCRHLTFFLQ